jgi:hypothetical protein
MNEKSVTHPFAAGIRKFRRLFLLGVFGLLLPGAQAQPVPVRAFSTTNDFFGWSDNNSGIDFTVSSTAGTDLDNVTLNGLGAVPFGGGPSMGGTPGTAGSLAIGWKPAARGYGYIFSAGEQGNSAFLDAITATTNVTIRYTTPTNNGGSYFQIGLALNYDGHFDQMFPIDATTDASGITTATFDFENEAGAIAAQRSVGLTYFQFGFIYNSDYDPKNSTYYVDDVIFLTTTPPPTLSIAKAGPPGLTIFGSGLNPDGSVNQWQRQHIATRGNFPWVGSPGNTVFSMTITNFPDTLHSNFQAHMFLIGNLPANYPGSAADFNDTNVVFLRVEQMADGSAQGLLMFKTNAAGSFPFFGNLLATLNVPKVLGTWSLTFNQNTNIILSGPGSVAVSATISAATASKFAGNLTTYIGIQPNDPSYFDQSATFSSIRITTNSVVALNDNFTAAPLDVSASGRWRNRSLDAAGVTVVPVNGVFWLRWTRPNLGFSLQSTSGLLGTWSDPGLVTYDGADITRAVVTSNSLPSATHGFYRLINAITP